MSEKLRIKEHMEVSNCEGIHVGTVGKVQDDAIEKIDDNRIYLKESARIPEGIGTRATV